MEIVDIQEFDLKDLSLLYEELIDKKTNFEKMLANYEALIDNGQYFLIGAKSDNKLLGSLMGIKCYDLVGECFPFMVVENVIVSESHRGMGIGRKLFERIEEIATENDCSYIFFVSSDYREGAHKFYESIGYTKDKVRGFKKFLRADAF